VGIDAPGRRRVLRSREIRCSTALPPGWSLPGGSLIRGHSLPETSIQRRTSQISISDGQPRSGPHIAGSHVPQAVPTSGEAQRWGVCPERGQGRHGKGRREHWRQGILKDCLIYTGKHVHVPVLVTSRGSLLNGGLGQSPAAFMRAEAEKASCGPWAGMSKGSGRQPGRGGQVMRLVRSWTCAMAGGCAVLTHKADQ
jgi:hypothetical protein